MSLLTLWYDGEEEMVADWLSQEAASKLQTLVLYLREGSPLPATVVQSLAQLELRSLEIISLDRPDREGLHAPNLQPLSSSNSLTTLTLTGRWDGPVNIAHLPSKLVDLTTSWAGLGGLENSEEVARRLGLLTSLQLEIVNVADLSKLAVLTRLRSLSLGQIDGSCSTANLQRLSTLSGLTQLRLMPSQWQGQGGPRLLPLLRSLGRLQCLRLWETLSGSLAFRVSISTAVNIVTSSPHLTKLEVLVPELSHRYAYRSRPYVVKSVSRSKEGCPGVIAET